MRKKLLRSFIFLILLSTAALTGCSMEMPQIIEKKKDPYEQTELSDTEIESDVYYAKSGTKFIKVAELNGSAQGKADGPSPSRVVWMQKKEQLIPTLYKGDSIAVKADTIKLQNVTLERFRDAGYSIGIYGASYNDSTGLIDLDYSKNVADGTPAEEAFSSGSKEIHLETIGGRKVTKDMLDSSGVLNCFEQNKSYEITYYAGTVYNKVSVDATQHVLESWEIYTDDQIEMTKKGYLSISIPEDYKSGIYMVEGKGFIKYIDHEKGSGAIPTGNEWNVPYYTSEGERRSAYSQAYSVTFDKKTLEPTIQVTFDADSIETGVTPEATVIAPDGLEYTMDLSDTETPGDKLNIPSGKNAKFFTLALQEATPGKWVIYLTPKSMQILDVQVISNGNSEMTTEEDLTLTLPEASQNMTYYVRWQQSDTDISESSSSATNKTGNDIFGYFIYPDGETFNLTVDDKINELRYETPYLPAGTYTMKIYHYSDKTVDSSISTRVTGTQVDQEIVSVSK